MCYMDHIQFPPTVLSTVIETLRRSQEVAKECGEDYAVVTYDLNLVHSNPIVFHMLKNGGFSIRRNEQQFNRVGVDMCLEQTTNAQAKKTD